MIKFSIIIPVYNVENYLRRCLDSVFAQTYQNFEVICVNDGSNDSSLSILNEYQANNSNLILIDQKNKGLGGARNSGVPYATGDYIWFVDSDDWIESEALLQLNRFILKIGRIDIFLFDTYKTDGTNKSIMKSIPQCKFEVLPTMYYLNKLLTRHALYAAWFKIFERKKYQDSKYLFEDGFFEDIPLMRYYFEQNCSMAYLQEPLYNYYRRNNSIMRTFDKRVLNIFQQYNVVYNSLIIDVSLEKDLAAFFYRVMLDFIEKPMNNVVKKEFLKIYTDKKKAFPYFSKYCLLNRKMTFKRRLKIIIKLIIPIKLKLT